MPSAKATRQPCCQVLYRSFLPGNPLPGSVTTHPVCSIELASNLAKSCNDLSQRPDILFFCDLSGSEQEINLHIISGQRI